jgi:hypothetical protein
MQLVADKMYKCWVLVGKYEGNRLRRDDHING